MLLYLHARRPDFVALQAESRDVAGKGDPKEIL
jgi:hypothetical protein